MATLNRNLVGTITAAIVDGSAEKIADRLRAQYKLSKKQWERYYAQAQEDIRIAATCDRQTELAIAKKQLEQIINTAISAGDISNAIKARDQLSKLLRLNELLAPVQIEIEESGEVFSGEDADLVRRYLESLGVTKKDLPLTELARIVVEWVLSKVPQEEFAIDK